MPTVAERLLSKVSARRPGTLSPDFEPHLLPGSYPGPGHANRAPRRQTAGMTELEGEKLLAELGRARALLEAVERRARTYLVQHGVLDQTRRDLESLVRETLAGQPSEPRVTPR
jgi:hypothetical protein